MGTKETHLYEVNHQLIVADDILFAAKLYQIHVPGKHIISIREITPDSIVTGCISFVTGTIDRDFYLDLEPDGPEPNKENHINNGE